MPKTPPQPNASRTEGSRLGEFIRFGLVGVLNTGIDLGSFTLLYRLAGLEPLLANTIAFLIAVTNSYWLNRRWTFRQQEVKGPLAYGRFVLLNIGGLILGSLAILLLGRFMALELAKIIASLVTLIWNYLSSRYFIFKPAPQRP